MVKPKKSKGYLKKNLRYEKIVKEFEKQQKAFPDYGVPDYIRGLAEAFDVSEMTVRRALKSADKI